MDHSRTGMCRPGWEENITGPWSPRVKIFPVPSKPTAIFGAGVGISSDRLETDLPPIEAYRPRLRANLTLCNLHNPFILSLSLLVLNVSGLCCRGVVTEFPGNQLRPVLVRGESGSPVLRVCEVHSGSTHTCLLGHEGEVRCWGDNGEGQLGDGTRISRGFPADIGQFNGAVALSAGGAHSCAVLHGLGVKCWGENRYGQLGNGSRRGTNIPVEVVGLDQDAVVVSAGGWHTCVLDGSGGVRCWGLNYSGQLGDGTRRNRSVPVDVVRLPRRIITVSAGSFHTCAVTVEGKVFCWGHNHQGQLGTETEKDMSVFPVPVEGLSEPIVSVSAGGWHTCAIDNGGNTWCWGYNYSGQLGVNHPVWSGSARKVAGLDLKALSISSGVDHTCSVFSGGGVWCWGGSRKITSPCRVDGIGGEAVFLSSGGDQACAVNNLGNVYCWKS